MNLNLAFSQCPPYDEKIVDAIIGKYCTVSAITAVEKSKPEQKGVNVAKRIDAIRQTLSENGGPLYIFGDVELDIFRKK